MDRARDQHAPRLGQRFEPRRDVDAVAVDPLVVVDHVAQVDADAEAHAAGLGHARVARGHHGLDLHRALGGADDAGELGHDAVAGGVDDPPAVAADQRQDRALVGLEGAHGGGLVVVHEPAVPGDVGGEDGGEPTLHRGLLLEPP